MFLVVLGEVLVVVPFSLYVHQVELTLSSDWPFPRIRARPKLTSSTLPSSTQNNRSPARTFAPVLPVTLARVIHVTRITLHAFFFV